MPENPRDPAAPRLVERRSDRTHPGRVAEQFGEVVTGLVADDQGRDRDRAEEHHRREHRGGPSSGADEVQARDRGRQFHPRREPDEQAGQPPSGAVDGVQHREHQQHVDLSVVEIAPQRFDPDADCGPQHGDASAAGGPGQ